MRPIDADSLKDKIHNTKLRVKSPEMMAGLVEMKAAALREIENAPVVNRWILCSEAMPEIEERVLLKDIGGEVWLGELCDINVFDTDIGFMALDQIVYWSKIPE